VREEEVRQERRQAVDGRTELADRRPANHVCNGRHSVDLVQQPLVMSMNSLRQLVHHSCN
jgi:hypothetical protein